MVASQLMNTSSSIFKNKVNCYRSRPARLSVRTKVAESTFIGTEQVPDGPPLRTLDDLPVERGLPFLGIALTAIKPDFPDKLEHVFEKHQSDSIILNLGPYGKFFATQSIPDMQEVSVVKASDVYTKWPAGVERLVLQDGRSRTNEESMPWRGAVGKILSPATIMQHQLPLIVSQFTDKLREVAKKGEEVKWYNISKRLTFSAACRAATGTALTDEDLDEMFPIAVKFGHGVFSPDFGLPEGVPGTMYSKSHKAKKLLLEKLKSRIDPMLKDRKALEGTDSVLKHVIAALEEEGIDTTSDENGWTMTEKLAREVIALMFAGTDSTSFVMSRSLVMMAKHPEWLTALGEEQDRLMKEHGTKIDRTVVRQSAIATAIAQECLRLESPLIFLYRRAQKDIAIGDVFVPEGTDFAMCPRKAIKSTGNGSPEFDPQQWLSEDRTQCTPNESMGNFVMGKGPRSCIGRNLAMIELITFLAILGREVSAVLMTEEEIRRPISLIGDHPTGMPVTFSPKMV